MGERAGKKEHTVIGKTDVADASLAFHTSLGGRWASHLTFEPPEVSAERRWSHILARS